MTDDDRPDNYADVIEAVATKYAPRILAKLTELRDALIAAGIRCEVAPFDMSDDYYRWRFDTTPSGEVDDASVDVCVEIAEAAAYGDDPVYGINFALDVVRWGGLILGGLTPFNYTDECWVDATDEEAVETRFQMIEEAPAEGLVDLILGATAPTGPRSVAVNRASKRAKLHAEDPERWPSGIS